jgi:hypothetical protein
LFCDESGQEHVETAEVVIDASGNHGEPLGLGAGGLPAIGERAVRSRIDYRFPNVLGDEQTDFADQPTLVFGHGVIAASAVIALTELAEKYADTHVTWVTRDAAPDDGPVTVPSNERLPRRGELAERANHLATGGHPALTWVPNYSLESIQFDEDRQRFRIVMTGDEQERRFRRVVADVGFRPDLAVFRELQVQVCPVTESISGGEGKGPQKMVLGEPDFYVLGAKNAGRGYGFDFAMGVDQIQQLFTIIGDREDLDLYATAKSLPK